LIHFCNDCFDSKFANEKNVRRCYRIVTNASYTFKGRVHSRAHMTIYHLYQLDRQSSAMPKNSMRVLRIRHACNTYAHTGSLSSWNNTAEVIAWIRLLRLNVWGAGAIKCSEKRTISTQQKKPQELVRSCTEKLHQNSFEVHRSA